MMTRRALTWTKGLIILLLLNRHTHHCYRSTLDPLFKFLGLSLKRGYFPIINCFDIAFGVVLRLDNLVCVFMSLCSALDNFWLVVRFIKSIVMMMMVVVVVVLLLLMITIIIKSSD